MQKNARKNIIYSIILLLVVFSVFLYRKNQEPPQEEPKENGKITFSGKTMGTTYRIVYLDKEDRDFKSAVDSILKVFNQSLSTYIPDSELSQFNQGDSLVFDLPYLLPVLKKSQEVYTITGGAFDPTVGPLVNAWGFGPEGGRTEDSIAIKNLLPLVGFELVTFDEKGMGKTQPGVYLDFSAIAKGYAVDILADFLEEKGISNMLVEIGGELVAHGNNDQGELWKVGINRPDEGGFSNDIFSIVALDNKGMATSGNYRNFYQVDSVKYSHTISPFTGQPVRHGLLSATVLAADCMTADAYATSMMVLGTEESIALLDQVEELEAFLIYNDESGNIKTFISESLKPYVSNIKE
ncbi:MAG: FAD:protein FMN transferase [Anditalea sp.]